MNESTPQKQVASDRKSAKQKLLADAYRFCNDAARLKMGLSRVLIALGVSEWQTDKIIIDVRAADFSSLCKCLKITW